MPVMVTPSAISAIVIARIEWIIPVRIIAPVRVIISARIPRMSRIIPIGLVPPGIQISRRITAVNIDIMVIMMIDHLWRIFLTSIKFIPIDIIILVIIWLVSIIFIIIDIRLNATASYLGVTSGQGKKK
jgi:hypothetical protein